jgi:hypothetical protein
MTEERQIFKIQMPVSSDKPNPPALIYNEDKSIIGYVHITPDLEEAMDNRPKAFFYGKKIMLEDGAWAMGWEEEAPWQGW